MSLGVDTTVMCVHAAGRERRRGRWFAARSVLGRDEDVDRP
jgi:hypothetical protein